MDHVAHPYRQTHSLRKTQRKETGQELTCCPWGTISNKGLFRVHTEIPESALFLTCGVGEVEDAGCRVQQVGAAGRQVAGDGHDGHAVTTLLGTHDAVVLRLTHAAITREGSEGWSRGKERVLKEKGCDITREREREKETGTLDSLYQIIT